MAHSSVRVIPQPDLIPTPSMAQAMIEPDPDHIVPEMPMPNLPEQSFANLNFLRMTHDEVAVLLPAMTNEEVLQKHKQIAAQVRGLQKLINCLLDKLFKLCEACERQEVVTTTMMHNRALDLSNNNYEDNNYNRNDYNGANNYEDANDYEGPDYNEQPRY